MHILELWKNLDVHNRAASCIYFRFMYSCAATGCVHRGCTTPPLRNIWVCDYVVWVVCIGINFNGIRFTQIV